MVFAKLIVIAVFVIVGIVIFTLVLGGWVIARAANSASRAIGGIIGGPRPIGGGVGAPSRYVPTSPAMLRCPQPRCHAENHPSARFCRRCGMVMNGQAVAVRRVRRRPDMW
jgi:hypothetical protein